MAKNFLPSATLMYLPLNVDPRIAKIEPKCMNHRLIIILEEKKPCEDHWWWQGVPVNESNHCPGVICSGEMIASEKSKQEESAGDRGCCPPRRSIAYPPHKRGIEKIYKLSYWHLQWSGVAPRHF